MLYKLKFFKESFSEDDDSDKDSADSDYMPKKTIVKVKRGRGRPRKNPDEPPKIKKLKISKTPGKRGRKPGSKNKVKEPGEISVKRERDDDDYGEFPCPICNEMFHSILKLDKHARMKHEGEKVIFLTKTKKLSDNTFLKPLTV